LISNLTSCRTVSAASRISAMVGGNLQVWHTRMTACWAAQKSMSRRQVVQSVMVGASLAFRLSLSGALNISALG